MSQTKSKFQVCCPCNPWVRAWPLS